MNSRSSTHTQLDATRKTNGLRYCTEIGEAVARMRQTRVRCVANIVEIRSRLKVRHLASPCRPPLAVVAECISWNFKQSRLETFRVSLNPGRAPSFARAAFVSLFRAFFMPLGRGVAPL